MKGGGGGTYFSISQILTIKLGTLKDGVGHDPPGRVGNHVPFWGLGYRV